MTFDAVIVVASVETAGTVFAGGTVKTFSSGGVGLMSPGKTFDVSGTANWTEVFLVAHSSFSLVEGDRRVGLRGGAALSIYVVTATGWTALDGDIVDAIDFAGPTFGTRDAGRVVDVGDIEDVAK